MSSTVLVNGQPATSINVSDRGLAYGDGVFETILVNHHTPVLLERHMKRLQAGCHALHISGLDISQLTRQIHHLASQHAGRWLLRIIVTRGNGLGGYASHRCAGAPTTVISLSEWTAEEANLVTDGIRLHLCEYRLPHNPVLAGIKHLNRLDQVMGRSEWVDEFHEGLMLDSDGHVIEGTMSNIFLCYEGSLFTPDLSQCGIAGVMRAHLLELCQQLLIPCTVKRVTLDDVRNAQALFMCNSVRGIWPVRQFSGIDYSDSTIVSDLQSRIAPWFR